MTLTQPLRKALIRAVPCLAALALLTTASPANAAPPSPSPAGTDYVALGSSFAAGPGIPNIIDPPCGRSDNNYAHLVAEALQLTLTDVTCIMAPINNIIGPPQNGKPCPGLPLDQEEIKYSLDVARQLALATKHAAQRTGAELVELSKASRHHDVCSADPWVTAWEFGPDIFAGGALAYHPNAEGMEAAAALVINQLS